MAKQTDDTPRDLGATDIEQELAAGITDANAQAVLTALWHGQESQSAALAQLAEGLQVLEAQVNRVADEQHALADQLTTHFPQLRGPR